jgi:cytochrome oxidase Cu insertion factor (SCO1/SenC/PrrC family)
MKNKLIVALAVASLISATAAFAQLGPKDSVNMSATEIARIKIGQAAPDFALENIDGKAITLSDFRGKKAVLLVFYRGYW